MATRKMTITIEFEDSDFIQTQLESVVYGALSKDAIITVSKPQRDEQM